jgi:HPt (histidine-containing phosphotransfer) domain-containing protein
MSADPAWGRSSGLESTLSRLGFTSDAASPDSAGLVLVHCLAGEQVAASVLERVSQDNESLYCAVVSDEVSACDLAALRECFHGVLRLPVAEGALVDMLAERGYIAITASERRELSTKVHELVCEDATVAQHFIRLLIDTNQSTLDALRDAFGAASWESVASAAHRIAGSMRMLDCADMVALLVRLEAAAHERDAVLARAILLIVANSLESLDTSLEKLLDPAARR